MPLDYEVELFREKSFRRIKCKSCGRFFWSLDEREICGEPPCQEYSFIGNSPMKEKLQLYEMRETFLSFFEKKSHKRVSRYPVVARWRDDIFFTIASISCFQPWVLNRTISPPANPLVMSQPSLRFNDIDRVGKTGRHLTLFEMMAHHAFNTPDNWVYFKDNTVKLCHDFLLSLGVPSEEIIYLEAEWAGGGNSGPCFEVVVRGVELATLVFMMYDGEGKGRKPMEMQVVDTGYGLERFTWFSQGTPNVYEAIFGPILDKLKQEINFELDPKVLEEYSKRAGMVDSSRDIKKIKAELVSKLNLTGKDLKALNQVENLYAICDHTRALMFMLNDGIIPSNVKGGYFARLLARRTLRSLNFLGITSPLKELVGEQIDYSKVSFPELEKNKGEIEKILEIEERKYERTVQKGGKIIATLETKLGRRSKEKIPTAELIKLYDTHGLTPELVKEFSSLEVNIPENFYIQVAEKHEKPLVEEHEEKVIKLPSGIPDTVLGFYEDAQVKEFVGKVLAKVDAGIILDKTYFYAEGGGQEGDFGRIDDLEVVNTQKVGNIIIHKVRGDLNKVKIGAEVKGKIDWERRLQLMQHHTSAHIINGAARRVLGKHIWQAGSHKSEKLGRLDITHYSGLTAEELKKIENLANEVVKENREIEIEFMLRDNAESLFGFTIYQGGAVPGKELRIVNIKNWEVEACGGTHLDNTGEVGRIKLIRAKRIQDGVVRLEFKAGKAFKDYEGKLTALTSESGLRISSEEELKEIASFLSIPVEQVPEALQRFRQEWEEQREEIRRLEEKIQKLGGEKYALREKYKKMPVGTPDEVVNNLFHEWKSQQKDIQLLRDELSKLLENKLREKFTSGNPAEIEGVRVVGEIFSDLEVKNLLEISKSVIKDTEKSLLILINTRGSKAKVVVRSNSKISADKVALKISKEMGGGAHGNEKLSVGGGSSKGIEKIELITLLNS